MAVLLFIALRLAFPLLLLAAILLALFLRVLPMRREIRRQRREWDAKYVEGELLPEEEEARDPVGIPQETAAFDSAKHTDTEENPQE